MRRFYLAAFGFLQRRFGGRPPAVVQAHDVLSTAVLAIMGGDRHCPDDLDPVVFVLGVIRSVASHSGEPLEMRTVHESIDDTDVALTATSVEDQVLANDLAENFVKDVPARYRDYVLLLIEGSHRTAEERAAAMGITVEQVRYLDKAVRRLRGLWKS